MKASASRDFGAMAMQAADLTPEYIGAMRASGPQFTRLETDDFASMRAVG